jgi:hypothetical protein
MVTGTEGLGNIWTTDRCNKMMEKNTQCGTSYEITQYISGVQSIKIHVHTSLMGHGRHEEKRADFCF